MANVSRKAIAQALLAWLTPSGGPFVNSGLRLGKPEQAASPGKPGLYLTKQAEKITSPGEGQPPTRVFLFVVRIYSDASGNPAAIPQSLIDDLLDYVTVKLATDAAGNPLFASNGRQTLGAAGAALGVYDVVIDGTILIAAGDSQGKGQAALPIKLTLGQYP